MLSVLLASLFVSQNLLAQSGPGGTGGTVHRRELETDGSVSATEIANYTASRSAQHRMYILFDAYYTRYMETASALSLVRGKTPEEILNVCREKCPPEASEFVQIWSVLYGSHVNKSGGQTVFDYIPKAKTRVRTAASQALCYNDIGEVVDASAYPYESPEICIDALSLANKLERFSYQSELDVILGHEVFHKLQYLNGKFKGNSEDELLADRVTERLTQFAADVREFEETQLRINRVVSSVKDRLVQAEQEYIRSFKFTAEYCSLVRSASEMLIDVTAGGSSASDENLNRGFFAPGIFFSGMRDFTGVLVNVRLLAAACMPKGSNFPKTVAGVFKSLKRDVVPAKDFLLTFHIHTQPSMFGLKPPAPVRSDYQAVHVTSESAPKVVKKVLAQSIYELSRLNGELTGRQSGSFYSQFNPLE